MLHEYLPILIFLVVGGGLGVVMLVLGFLFGTRRPDPEKLSPYECGFEAFEDSRMLKRILAGLGKQSDLDLLVDVANRIEGHTICALGDAAAWPVQSFVKHFRDEFAYMRYDAIQTAKSAASPANSAKQFARRLPSRSNPMLAPMAPGARRVTTSTCSSASIADSARRPAPSMRSSRHASTNTTWKTAARTS